MLTQSSRRYAATFLTLTAFVLVTLTGETSAQAKVVESHVPVAKSSSWVWPVEAPHPIVKPFLAPQTQYSAGHRGIDIAAPSSAIVRSPTGGVIHFSGFVVSRNLVSIDHGGGIISSFEPVLSELSEGTLVHRGEQIGVLQSGHCSTPCLHFGVRLHGQYVSPLNYLGGLERSILLPTRDIP